LAAERFDMKVKIKRKNLEILVKKLKNFSVWVAHSVGNNQYAFDEYNTCREGGGNERTPQSLVRKIFLGKSHSWFGRPCCFWAKKKGSLLGKGSLV
jgi:hypothetical protein